VSQYTSWSDEEVLQAYEESLVGAWVDAEGDEAAKNRALVNAALDGVGRSDLGIEAMKRKRKWKENVIPAPGTLPETVPIANPDRLAIVQATQPNYTYLNT